MPNTEPIYIAQAAETLDRRIGTIRKWERENRLPPALRPKRDERGWRYWNEEQLDRIREWMVTEDLRPGKGLPHNRNRPDEERVREHIQRLRQPKLRNR